MNARRTQFAKSTAARRQAKGRNTFLRSHGQKRRPKQARRAGMQQQTLCEPFAPPEDWYEPTGRTNYKIVVQEPGEGYRHILTPDQIRARLAQVPQKFIEQLEVVQLSRMTRKKQSFPCYGMQWGNTLYLYPIEESFVEHYDTAPPPNLMNETRMYGAEWAENPEHPGGWTLTWSEQAAQDFYSNNILIHELGHLVDDRNTTYMDRERYAEWFAVEYGYRASGGRGARSYEQQDRGRRHHAKSK